MTTFLWFIVLYYLNDFFIILTLEANIARFQFDFDNLHLELRVTVNEKKSIYFTKAEFLSIELNSIKMKVRLSLDKLDKARMIVIVVLSKNFILHIDLQLLVDFLSFAIKVIVLERLFLRRLLNALKVNAQRHRVTRHIRLNLLWWHKFLFI